MTDNYLAKHGPAVARNGWPIVLLGANSKKPLENKWASKPAPRLEYVQRLIAAKRNMGIGIRCGNIVALDNDYEEGGVVTADFLAAIVELQRHFFPKVLMRRGRPERPPLQVFRLKDDKQAKSLNLAKLQILGIGRQFVAYNMHPDAGVPYAWLKAGVGSPASMKLADVPQYEHAALIDFMRALQLLEDTWGLSEKAGGDALLQRIKSGDYKPNELKGEQATITHAAKYVENKAEWGWEEWNNRIMMPLWGASGGADWGLELAHQISEQHALYDRDATEARWEALAKSPPSRVGAGTLLWQARQGGMPYLGPTDWDDYKVFIDRDDLLNSTTSDWVSRTMFNDLFNGQKVKGSTPLQTFMTGRPEQIYSTTIWDPTITTGDALQAGRKVWNTAKLPTDYGTEGDIEPWLDLMHNIYGEHFDTIMQRMAFDVQHPAAKPQWHELLIGKHGVGKNLTKAPLRLWFEQTQMARTINADRIEGAFNSYVKNVKHLEIEEVAGVNSRIFNRLKSMLASMDPWYEIDEKFLRPYRMRNVISAWLSTNEIDSVTLSPTERRLYVVHKKDAGLSERELVRTFEWTKRAWPHVIHHLKHNVEVAETFGNLLPAQTDDMLELVHTAGRMHDKLRVLLRETCKGVTVFNLSELHMHLIEAGVCERPGQLVTLETARKALLAEGAIRCHGGQPVKIDGVATRCYTFAGAVATATPDEIRANWLASGSFRPIVQD